MRKLYILLTLLALTSCSSSTKGKSYVLSPFGHQQNRGPAEASEFIKIILNCPRRVKTFLEEVRGIKYTDIKLGDIEKLRDINWEIMDIDRVSHYSEKLQNIIHADQADLDRIKITFESHVRDLQKAGHSRQSAINILEDEIKDLKEEIIHRQRVLGMGMINDSLFKAAKEKDSVIIARHMNLEALPFVALDGSFKPLFIKGKSADTGIIKGLIPSDQKFSMSRFKDEQKGLEQLKKFQDQVNELLKSQKVQSIPYTTHEGTAVVRNGEQIFANDLKETDEVIEVLADKYGQYYTADLDLFAIARKDGTNLRPRTSNKVNSRYGVVTSTELSVIREINQNFQRMDNSNATRYLVQHGPEAYNPNPLEVQFPLYAYLPNGKLVIIKKGPSEDPLKNLRKFNSILDSNGYALKQNSNW